MKLTDNLRDTYETKIATWDCEPELRKQIQTNGRRLTSHLRRRGIETFGDLLRELPVLPAKLARSALMVLVEREPAVAPLLWQLMSREELRITCADRLGWMALKRFETKFIGIGFAELAKATPDSKRLETAVLGLRHAKSAAGADFLVSTFERREVRGWIRSDVADALGTIECVGDRRSKLFRRVIDAAITGLSEDDIYMQFGSMYVLGSLACHYESKPKPNRNAAFFPALPRLREIAANDSRLSPGLWWPMSAEAEDVIGCIETGHWPHPDAGERWPTTGPRGEWNRD